MTAATGKEKEYSRQKIRLSILHTVLTFVFLILILISGVSDSLRNLVTNRSENFYIQAAFYFIIFGIIYNVVFMSLDFYTDFILENKFELSNQTFFDWLKQTLKKWAISFVLFIAAMEGLYTFLRHFPNNWWLASMVGWFAVVIVLSKIAPVLIIPLFYKCTKLDNDDLKQRLLKLSETCNVKIKEVYEIQLSKETKKANAAVVGFGKNRRILLGDTLKEKYSSDEVEAIFAHELGHMCLYHVWKIFAFGAAVSFAVFYLAYVSFDKSMVLFGFKQVYDVAAFPLLLLIFSLAGLIFVPVQNWFSRRIEKQADLFAIGHIRYPEHLASALSKLGEQNLSDPCPGRFTRIFFYTHPPIAERISYINKK